MKTTPIEVVIPDWAKWIAQDESGDWYAYDLEPEEHQYSWGHSCERTELVIETGCTNPNWRETLRRIE